jgi:hypothetical protein
MQSAFTVLREAERSAKDHSLPPDIISELSALITLLNALREAASEPTKTTRRTGGLLLRDDRV